MLWFSISSSSTFTALKKTSLGWATSNSWVARKILPKLSRLDTICRRSS